VPTNVKNGDKIAILAMANQPGLTASADFSNFDSNYTAGAENVTDNGDNTYAIEYTISSGNTISDIISTIPVTITDSNSSDSVNTNAITLDNTDPTSQAQNVSFVDTDTTQNQLAGTIDFDKAPSESDIDRYEVTITDNSGNVYTKYVTADGSASYSVTVSKFTVNDNSNITISVTAIDAAGNMGTPVTQSVTDA